MLRCGVGELERGAGVRPWVDGCDERGSGTDCGVRLRVLLSGALRAGGVALRRSPAPVDGAGVRGAAVEPRWVCGGVPPVLRDGVVLRGAASPAERGGCPARGAKRDDGSALPLGLACSRVAGASRCGWPRVGAAVSPREGAVAPPRAGGVAGVRAFGVAGVGALPR